MSVKLLQCSLDTAEIKYPSSTFMFHFLLSLLLSSPILWLPIHLFSFLFPRKKTPPRQCDLPWEYLTQMRQPSPRTGSLLQPVVMDSKADKWVGDGEQLRNFHLSLFNKPRSKGE